LTIEITNREVWFNIDIQNYKEYRRCSMKKFFLATLVLSILLAFVGCRSTNQTLTELGGKYEVIQVSDTGFVGHDNSGFVVLQKQSSTASQVSPSSVQPQKAIEVTTYESSSLTWTGCPDKGWKPNRRAKNIKRTEERKKWTTERDIQPTPPPVVHQERVAIPIAVYGGGNASVGNSLLPSIATAGGIIGGAAVLRPSETNVSSTCSA